MSSIGFTIGEMGGNETVAVKSVPDVTKGKKQAPLKPYMLFKKDEKDKVDAKFPHYSFAEKSKEIGRRWSALDEHEKESYSQRYRVILFSLCQLNATQIELFTDGPQRRKVREASPGPHGALAPSADGIRTFLP